jgi:hypothetical protein
MIIFFKKSIEHKTKCRCFFDAGGLCKRLLAGLTKHFCILLMPQKFDAVRQRALELF